MRFYHRLREILNEPVYQVAIIIFLFEAAFTPAHSHMWDPWFFQTWCQCIYQNGIGNIYKIQNAVYNYPPFVAYVLYVFGKFQGSLPQIGKYFYFFKLFPLLADFIAAVALINLLDDKKRNILWLLLLVANPVFIYNSYCWGQVDGILSLFVLTAFIGFLRGKIFQGIFFFTLALNFKIHAIIFLPPLLLLAYYRKPNPLTIRIILLCLLTFMITQFCILFPFIIAGETKSIWKIITTSVGFNDCITCNAYNVWFFLVGKKEVWSSDMQTWLSLTYRLWGFIMLSGLSFIVLFPLMLAAISKVFKGRIYTADRDSLFLIFALIPLLFFYFNTQMHERFGHTALLFTAAFAFSTRRYWLFVLICAAYFGNMEGILHFFNFPNYGVLIFDPYWVASLYLLLIISLFYFLYKPFILQLKLNYARTG